MNSKSLLRCGRRSLLCSSWLGSATFATTLEQTTMPKSHSESFCPSSSSIRYLVWFPIKPTSSFSSSATLRSFNTKSSTYSEENGEYDDDKDQDHDEAWEEGESTDGWEEEDDAEPEIGDGGDGGGVVLKDVPWGERVLSIAHEVLHDFGDDMTLFSFKTSPRGYIYVRLDKLSNKYGCPSMEEIENYNSIYKKRLEEIGQSGEVPDDLGVEVSSPGVERILKVPEDLDRFKDMPMRVCYVEGDLESKSSQKDGVFLLESIETEAEHCVWKLADVKENRDLAGKGRPLNRKQKDWRLRLPFAMLRRVTLYLDY